MSVAERGEFERRLLEAHRARREKFFPPAKPVEIQVDPKIVEIAPRVVKSPYEDVMDLMVAAVGNAAGLPVNEIIEGPNLPEVTAARRLAMALSVVRCTIPVGYVTKHFGVWPDAVRDAAKELTPLWRLYTFSSKTPIERTLVSLWPLWVSERESVKYPAVRDIQRAICKTFVISRDDLLSYRRMKSVVVPRQIAMALSKRLTKKSLPEIGRQFGGKDHTTVLHAVRKMAPLIQAVEERITPRSSAFEWATEAKWIYDAGIQFERSFT